MKQTSWSKIEASWHVFLVQMLLTGHLAPTWLSAPFLRPPSGTVEVLGALGWNLLLSTVFGLSFQRAEAAIQGVFMERNTPLKTRGS